MSRRTVGRELAWALLTLAAVGGASSCTTDTADVYVDLRTDYLPGVEFVFVHLVLTGDARTVDLPVTGAPRGADFATGRRVGEISALPPGRYSMDVELRTSADAVVAARRVILEIRGRTSVTVVIGRSCAGLVCPAVGADARATECSNGRCVVPDCGMAHPEACMGGCVLDTDCPGPTASCGRPVCADGGECLVLDDGTCGPAAFCHPDLGCRPLDGDAGRGDAGAGLDAGARSDACVAIAETCNGADDDCDGVADDGACGPSQSCVAGACVCTSGRLDCTPAPGCESPIDATNCGACGRTCTGAMPVCDVSASRCVSGCGPGQTLCGGACVTTSSDVSHCGACFAACSSVHGTAWCASSTCRITCDPGYDDCDATIGDGCETSLNTLADCGSCRAACALTRATETCATGTCRIATCDSAWGDCDGMDATGCEQDLTYHLDCGACGARCATNENCGASDLRCHCGGDASGPAGTGMSICPLTAHATSTRCTGAVPARCSVWGCASGWANCDGTYGNGCESTATTPANCCGAVCSGATPNCIPVAGNGDRTCGA